MEQPHLEPALKKELDRDLLTAGLSNDLDAPHHDRYTNEQLKELGLTDGTEPIVLQPAPPEEH